MSRSERKAALEPLAEFGGWGYGGVNRGRIVDVAGQNRLMLVCASADARIKRDQSVNATFAEQHPWPAAGAAKGPCIGWVIGHIKPFACGGAD